jgi:hypothetical protein
LLCRSRCLSAPRIGLVPPVPHCDDSWTGALTLYGEVVTMHLKDYQLFNFQSDGNDKLPPINSKTKNDDDDMGPPKEKFVAKNWKSVPQSELRKMAPQQKSKYLAVRFKLVNIIKVLDHSKNCLVWLLFDCIACRKCYILLLV